jgi:hypothetical protein
MTSITEPRIKGALYWTRRSLMIRTQVEGQTSPVAAGRGFASCGT